MQCSAFIATSLDGFIATEDGNVDWLHTAGNGVEDGGDLGFADFMASVDCLLMGRKTVDVIAAMNLTPEQWPYGSTPIWVMSNTLQQSPANLPHKVNISNNSLNDTLAMLEQAGHKHIYVDGGSLITQLIAMNRLSTLNITVVPIILGKGIRLFGELAQPHPLKNAKATVYKNDFIQYHYQL